MFSAMKNWVLKYLLNSCQATLDRRPLRFPVVVFSPGTKNI